MSLAAKGIEQELSQENLMDTVEDVASPLTGTTRNQVMAGKAKLASKKLAAQRLIGWVKKNGKLEAGTFSYDYAKAADVIKEARAALCEAGLSFISRNPRIRREVLRPASSVPGKNGGIYNKPATYLYMSEPDLGFSDPETGYEDVTQWYGEGEDQGDKGGPKSLTSAQKSFLIHNLLIPTGDDPEAGLPPLGMDPDWTGDKEPQDGPPPAQTGRKRLSQPTPPPAGEAPMVDQIADAMLGKEPDEFASDSALPPYNEKSKKIMDGLFDYYKAKIADMEGLAFNALKLRALVFANKGRWPETAVGATTIKSKIKPEEVADKV